MKLILACLAASLLACQISPTVTDPGANDDSYSNCRRASRDYCREALDTPASGMDKCVAEHTYKCLSPARS